MSTFTAQILVGQKHSYDGGIINITHSLYLSENDRPAWLLTPTNIFSKHDDTQPNIIWIPTLENMLEDALVMIGLYVLKDQNLINLGNQFFRNPKDEFIELYNDIKPEQLKELYKQARQIEGSHKIMLSVFEGSTILSQLTVLNHYQNDIEVCVSTFSKEFSLWSNRFETKGGLNCFPWDCSHGFSFLKIEISKTLYRKDFPKLITSIKTVKKLNINNSECKG